MIWYILWFIIGIYDNCTYDIVDDEGYTGSDLHYDSDEKDTVNSDMEIGKLWSLYCHYEISINIILVH